MKELAELNAIYQKMSTPDIDEAVYGGTPKKPEDKRMIVTNADKKGNTPAYQNFKAGDKRYKAADHMKEEEVIDEKMNAGLRAYLDKKKGKKGNGDKEDKKLDKREQGIARAAKKMSEGMSAPRMQKGAMAYDGPNKAASEAKDRVMAKTKAKRKGPKPTVTIDKPDSLVSMKVSKGYKESFDKLVESGKFSDLELQAFLFDAFEEGYQRNPEKDPQNKPYREKSKAERMADPDRGINSPAFKKFMASQGM